MRIVCGCGNDAQLLFSAEGFLSYDWSKFIIVLRDNGEYRIKCRLCIDCEPVLIE
jgi:hypothetical protein